MPLYTVRRFAPVAVVGVLFVAAVIIAAWRDYTTIAVLLALNGVLISGYLVRHRMRTRLVYDRDRHVVAPHHDEERVTSDDQVARN